MSNVEIYTQLNTIFREVLQAKDLQLTDDMTQGSVRGWDSINQIQIVLTVEEKFKIELSNDEILRLKTVGDIARIVGQKVSQKSL
jgi:acyl carrier protein